MQIPGEGKAFISVTDLVKTGYGSRNSIIKDIELGIIPAIRILPEGGQRARYAIPRDELILALEKNRCPVSAIDAVDGGEGVVS